MKADAFAPAPAGIRPEWYFLAPFYTLKLIPGHVLHLEGEFVGLIGFGVLALVWTLLPLWAVDRNGSVRRKLVDGAGVVPHRVSFDIFALGVLAMRYALILLLTGIPLPAKDSCLACHSALQGILQQPAAGFGSSVHLQQGFTCADCHGGDPNSDDPTVAMSRPTDSSAFPRGQRFRSCAPDATAIPISCVSTTPESAWTNTPST